MTAKLDTYLNYLRTSIAKNVPFRRGHDIALQFEIAGGLHIGSRTTLSKKSVVVGSAPTDDIMLLDEEISTGTVTLAADTSILGAMISVSTRRDDVAVGGVNITDPRGMQTFLLPCTIDIGGIPIRLSAERSTSTTGLTVREFTAIIALCWVGILGLGFAFNWGQPTTSQYAVVAEAGKTDLEPPAVIDPGEVARMLHDAGLSDYLRVVPKSEDALAVVGSLPVDLKTQWLEVRRDLDALSDRLVVFSEFDERANRPQIPAIAVVRLGQDPALIFADDRVAGIGDPVGDGWSISAITDTDFSITRYGNDLTVSYQ
ncbi:MAG: hypothetical protein AAFY14_11760 [Pseudomonadota bacterium]